MLSPNIILQQRYRVIRPIGQGGMGSVYEALDERLSSTVALKEAYSSEELLKKAFTREATLLANLRHPMLPKVIDYFMEGSNQYLVMEFIPGDDLAEQLKRSKSPFQPSIVLRWADQLLGALEYMHGRIPPVIHRDIKPSNLKLTSDGNIILLDFGLSKGLSTDQTITSTSQSIFGYTRNFAPLEQIQGQGTDPRSDLYALAATLYFLLTRGIIVDAVTRAANVLNGQADPLLPAHELLPSLPSKVSDVLTRAMALNRNGRFENAAAMRVALKEAGQDITVIEEAPPQAARPVSDTSAPRTVFERTEKEATVLLDQLTVHMKPEEFSSSPGFTSTPQTVLIKHSEVLTQQEEHVFEELILHQDYERLWRSLIHAGGGRNLLTGYGPFGGTSLIRCAIAKARTELQKIQKNEAALLVFYFRVANESKEHFQIEATNLGLSHMHGTQGLGSNTDFNELKARAGRNQEEAINSVMDFSLNDPVGAAFFSAEATATRVETARPFDDFTQFVANLNAFFKQKKSSKALRQIVLRLIRSERLPSRVVFIIDKIKHLETLESLSKSELFSNKRIRVIVVARKEDFDGWKQAYRRLGALDFSKWYVPCLWNIDWGRSFFNSNHQQGAQMEQQYRIFLKHLEYKGRGSLGNIIAELRHPMNTNYAKDHSFIDPVTLVGRAEIQHNSWVQEALDLNWSTILHNLAVGLDQDERRDRARIGIYLLMDWIAGRVRFNRDEAIEQSKNSSISISDDEELRVEAIDNLLYVLTRNKYLSLKDGLFRVVWDKNRPPKLHKVSIKQVQRNAASMRETPAPTGGTQPLQTEAPAANPGPPVDKETPPSPQPLILPSSFKKIFVRPGASPTTHSDAQEQVAPVMDELTGAAPTPHAASQESAAGQVYEAAEVATPAVPRGTSPSRKVFISYSHTDTDWLKRLHVHMKPFEREGIIELWDDTKINVGDNWRHEIKKAISSARIAIVMVSAQFLASEFIVNNELPPLLEASKKEGTLIVPIILSPCMFDHSKLADFQTVNEPINPLTSMNWNQQEALFVKVAELIKRRLTA
jgi:serine/threonine protein kinase